MRTPHNPRYARTYATASASTVGPSMAKSSYAKREPNDWPRMLSRMPHPGYINWEQFQSQSQAARSQRAVGIRETARACTAP